MGSHILILLYLLSLILELWPGIRNGGDSMNYVFPLKLKCVLFLKDCLHVAATITDIIAATNLCSIC